MVTVNLQGQVGTQTASALGDGSMANLRFGRQADLIVSELSPRYWEYNRIGNIFFLSARAQAPTAYTGASGGTPLIAVWNPPNSPVALVPLFATYSFTASASAAGVSSHDLYTGITANITQATTTSPICASNQLKVSKATGYVNVATTSSTALSFVETLSSYYWATAAGAYAQGPGVAELAGHFVVLPGSMMAIGLSVALTSLTGSAGLFWVEININSQSNP